MNLFQLSEQILSNFNLNQPNKNEWGSLYGSASTLAMSTAIRHMDGLVVIITQDMLTASRIEQEFRFFDPELSLFTFPDWETLPYDTFSPHQDIISQRLLTLYRLLTFGQTVPKNAVSAPILTSGQTIQKGLVIAPVSTLMQRITPRQHIEANSFVLQRGDTLHIDPLRLRLEGCGYRCVSQVMEHGEFAVRGSILDLFPMGSEQPYRIDLLDEEVDSIRIFDPETQRTSTIIEKIHLLPAREFPMTETAIKQFRQQWRDSFSGNPLNCPVYQDISQGGSAAGIEYYLPLFFDQTATLFDYFPSDTTVIRFGELTLAADNFGKEIQERYEQRRYDITRPLLAPDQLFLATDKLFAYLKTFSQIIIHEEPIADGVGKFNFPSAPPLTNIAIDNKNAQPLAKLDAWLKTTNNGSVLFCAETAGRREAILELLKTIDLRPTVFASWEEFLEDIKSPRLAKASATPFSKGGERPIGITIAPLSEGLCLTDPAITLITENQLFGQQVLQQRRRKTQQAQNDAVIRNLAELQIGAPVVHLDHGVGRYLGLQMLQVGQIPAEYLALEYAGGDKLYVPVSSLHLISRYSGGDPETAPAHRLGTEQWQKAKRKAAEQIRDAAAELLDIYARRATRPGHAFTYSDVDYRTFAGSFPFEETPDQQLAISQVIQDMIAAKSMDRLVCGDVGFGKTEVAMRAAFIAVQASKQVAVLVPTTLLAQQHFQNFSDRFADWPVRVEMISRFRSQKEQTQIVKQLGAGQVDILIGTHKLLQEDLKFSQLGLLIIDEEHRFGVRQKERIKALRSDVDILTLTATPIPRTLNMALSGMRDLSIIATPPARRLSIKTFVREREKALIREAILREILRGGQVYFLHNTVETIEKAAHELTELVPEARIAVAHGQMRERELERVMADFYHHRSNILICTTIIETGIDIPAANTIIIDRADRFGLAQLHQLRGRVGRSHHQAYAYLLIPSEKLISSDAKKRLGAITSMEDLGAGFTLATHDLEIRGAGELLGEEQSGSMHTIGFSLYMELLERAIDAIKSGRQPDIDLDRRNGAEIDLQIPALIPENYLGDVHTRLVLYKRIASANDQDALDDIQVEMIDRFGLLPEPTQRLFQITSLKLKASPLGIRKIEANNKGGRIDFEAKPNIDPMTIIQLIQRQPHRYKLAGPQRLTFSWEHEKPEEKITGIEKLIKTLENK
jgi:transcription-repair coupling factor (superfamily II helicase)